MENAEVTDRIDTPAAPVADGVVVRVAPTTNPLLAMSDAERMRLFIRVLCELVAYEPPET